MLLLKNQVLSLALDILCRKQYDKRVFIFRYVSKDASFRSLALFYGFSAFQSHFRIHPSNTAVPNSCQLILDIFEKLFVVHTQISITSWWRLSGKRLLYRYVQIALFATSCSTAISSTYLCASKQLVALASLGFTLSQSPSQRCYYASAQADRAVDLPVPSAVSRYFAPIYRIFSKIGIA